MALKITLKPFEQIVINQSIIRNGSFKAELYIENNSNILRVTDILKEKDVNTVATSIYFTLQLLYLFPKNSKEIKTSLLNTIQEYLKIIPNATLSSICQLIQDDHIYKALKLSKQLIKNEKDCLNESILSNGAIQGKTKSTCH